MSSPALSLEATTIHIAEEIQVRASIEATFAALLDQLGPYNETQVDKLMPMKLEAWPGGRWYRDLGDNNGHYWGTGAGDQEADAARNLRATVYVQPGDNESSISAEGIGRRDGRGISAPVVRSGAGGIQKREERLGAFARRYAAASGSAAASLRRGPGRSSEEGNMCPACIAGAAVMAAGAGSTGGILAVCIGKFRKVFRANGLGLFLKIKEK